MTLIGSISVTTPVGSTTVAINPPATPSTPNTPAAPIDTNGITTVQWMTKKNRHVTFYDANCKPRPATITNVQSATVIDLRVARTGQLFTGVNLGMPKRGSTSWRPK